VSNPFKYLLDNVNGNVLNVEKEFWLYFVIGWKWLNDQHKIMPIGTKSSTLPSHVVNHPLH
jgi:hypothetical protein